MLRTGAEAFEHAVFDEEFTQLLWVSRAMRTMLAGMMTLLRS